MKFLLRYSLPLVVIIYGILLEEKLVIAVRGTGNGFYTMIFGILLLFFSFYIEYSDFKYDDKGDIEETKKLVDYFCLLFFIFGLICMGLFLFGVIVNYFIFLGILATFIFCNKGMMKFI